MMPGHCLHRRFLRWTLSLWFLYASGAPPLQAAPGEFDVSFRGLGTISFFVAQPDGKLLVNSDGWNLGEEVRWGLSRFLPNGGLEARYVPDLTGYQGERLLHASKPIIVLPEGGSITYTGLSVPGSDARQALLKFKLDGSYDPSFQADLEQEGVAWVQTMLRQPDGKLLISGISLDEFRHEQPHLLRLLPDGGVDPTFHVTLEPNTKGAFSCLALQADGKILAGWTQPWLGTPSTAQGIRRFFPDGTVDGAFAPRITNQSLLSRHEVNHLVVQPDGKILAGGNWDQINSVPRRGVARLHPDGSLDQTFQQGIAGTIQALQLQADGRILAAGDFDAPPFGDPTIRRRLFRLHADGSVDTSFVAPAAYPSDSSPLLLALNEDGTVLAAGSWLSPLSQNYVAFARLENDPAVSVVEALGTSGVRWRRGGTAGEVGWVTFEAREAASSTWTLLGAGTRVTGGWELTGITLPTRGEVRARGYTRQPPQGIVERRLVFGDMAPVLALEHPAGAPLASAGPPLVLGSGWPGTVHRKTFVLRNAGDRELVDLEIAFSGPQAGVFRVSEQPELPLESQAVTTFTVEFTPQTIGSAAATLRLTGAGVTGGPFVIPLTGEGNATMAPIFTSPSDVALRTAAFSATGLALGQVTVTFEPRPGLALAVVNATSNDAITGTLADLPPLARVEVIYGGTVYSFQADYQGGTGNDLVLRLIAPGAPDGEFRPISTGLGRYPLVEQADGSLITAGYLPDLGMARPGLIRFRAGGVFDPLFHVPYDGEVRALAVQEDGKIIVGGAFTSIAGRHQPRLARLFPDGSFDPTFTPVINEGLVEAVLAQPNGRILAGGTFTAVGGTARYLLARVLSEGALDPSFQPPFVHNSQFDLPSALTTLALQPDGKVVVSGHFFFTEGTPLQTLTRLNTNGSRDLGFNPVSPLLELRQARALVALPEGKLLVGLEGVSQNTTRSGSLVRLLPDGSEDAVYHQTAWQADHISGLALQADGKMIVTGGFGEFSSPDGAASVAGSRVARVLPDGSVDASFNAGTPWPYVWGTWWMIRPHIQRSGAIYLGGDFESVGSTLTKYLARLFNDPVSSSLSLSAPSTLLWSRAGANFDLHRTVFDVFDATAGAWSPLGTGTRVTEGWSLAGVSLPAAGAVRARGFLGNGSQGIAEEWLTLGAAAPSLVMETAEGIPLPQGTGTVVFPRTLQGVNHMIAIRLRNQGAGVLPVPFVSITGPQASDFQILNAPQVVVGPQETLELLLEFTPPSAGTRTAELAVTFPGQSGGPYTITLRGEGSTELDPHFATPNDVPFSRPQFSLAGKSLGTLTLGFTPQPGLVLTVLDQTGSQPFDTTFADLPQEGEVAAEYNGQTYVFRANYRGASNNSIDLTLSLLGPGLPEAGYQGWPVPLLHGLSQTSDGRMLVVGNQAGIVRRDGTLESGGFSLGSTGRFAHALEQGWLLATATNPFAPPPRRPGVVRILPDGAIDPAYQTQIDSDYIATSALRPDGTLLVASNFAQFNNQPRHRVALLKPDGTLDDSFIPNPGPGNSSGHRVRAVLPLPEGRVLVGGNFFEVGATERVALTRYQADGAWDEAFPTRIEGPSQVTVTALARQADEKILLGGFFSKVNGVDSPHLARIHADGSLDTTFVPPAPNNSVHGFSLQADGKIIVVGQFTEITGVRRTRVARLLPNGALDTTFTPEVLGGGVTSTLLQADGKLVVGGDFSLINRFPRNSLARLLNDPATETLSVPDAATVRWLRGGSSPETHHVWFDVSIDAGATWARLGDGSRIDGGWQLTGLNLPTAGHLRARARIVGGFYNASSSLVESVTLFGREPTALEQWRATHFGSPLSGGDGRDDADPDHDGLPNLMEYALGLDPRADSTAEAPRWASAGDHWELRVRPAATATGVVCAAEWSADLRPDSWQPAADEGDAAEHAFRVPVGTHPALYVRWRVTTAP